jgi:hypothetical protein
VNCELRKKVTLLYRGEWNQCTSYNQGDTASHDGHLWEAEQQNAGKEPGLPCNAAYWTDMGAFTPAGSIRHDDTTEKSTTKEGEYNHISDDEADAVLNARAPSAENPFATLADIPELALRLGDFAKRDMPPGLGMIYAAHYDTVDNVLAVAGDGIAAWFDMQTGEWFIQELSGEWRGLTKHLDVYVAVGKDKIAAGIAGDMVIVANVAGDWKDAETSGGAVVAVADGRTASSADGLTGWTARDELPGYGDSVAYNNAEGLFFAVGRLGCLKSEDGDVWTIDETMPAGTWRDIIRGHECMFALSGRSAHRPDGGDWELDDPMPAGGWEAGANGSGYNLAIGNGIAALSGERAHNYTVKAIPNYVSTCVVYGAGRFWALGSAIVAAVVTDIAGALGAAEGASESNPFVTETRLAEVQAGLENKIDLDIDALRAELEEAKTLWQGDV